VKTQDVSAACTRISKGPGTVLVLANGLAADTLAATLLGDRRITPGVLFLEATMREPGQIDLRGRIQIAVPLGAAAETDELGRACTIERRRDFEGVRWTKLIANLQNGLNAALGTPLQESLRGAGGALAVDLFREGMDVAAAAHVPLAPTPVLDPGTAWFLRHAPRPVAVAALRRSVRRTFGDRAIPGSTLQSLWRGKPTEVRWLNGAIAHEGRRRGVATPLNDAIVAAVESVEQGGAFTTADAVRDRIRRAGPP
jgi:2-dehydropantoate 2-reductase